MPVTANLLVFFIPALEEVIQYHQHLVFSDGLVNAFQVDSNMLAVFPRHVFQYVAHHMQDTKLDLGLLIHIGGGIRKALQSVDAGDHYVCDNAILQLGQRP